MIISNNTNPRREIYYLGALTIEVLNQESKNIDLFDLFHKVNNQEEITMNLFLFVLDWLYLTETIELHNGAIKLCS